MKQLALENNSQNDHFFNNMFPDSEKNNQFKTLKDKMWQLGFGNKIKKRKIEEDFDSENKLRIFLN